MSVQTRIRSGSNQVNYNVAVVGGGAVGKSALTIQFVKHVFCDEYDPTIEDQHRKQAVIDDECALLEILDTAGQEEFTAMRDQYLRTGEGFIVVFSICSKPSFDEACEIYEQILRAKDVDDVPVVFVGNKCDLEDKREVSKKDALDFIKSTQSKYITYLESSAKTRINVDECFHTIVRKIREQNKPAVTKKAGARKKLKKISPGCNLL